MTNKKNIILTFGNKEFNNSLIELKSYFNFNLKILDDLEENTLLESCQGLLIHEDGLKTKNLSNIIENKNINKIIFHNSNNVKGFENIEKLALPTSVEQINKIVVNNVVKKELMSDNFLQKHKKQLDWNVNKQVLVMKIND